MAKRRTRRYRHSRFQGHPASWTAVAARSYVTLFTQQNGGPSFDRPPFLKNDSEMQAQRLQNWKLHKLLILLSYFERIIFVYDL